MIDKIKRAYNKGDFFEKIIVFIIIILGYSNENIKDLEIRNKKFNKIEKKYSKCIKNKIYNKENHEFKQIVWVCWLQGEETAPDIVKYCYQSIKNTFLGWEINFIDLDNYEQFITLPDYIKKKYVDGIITQAHFSDIIRTQLLVEFGGIWIDSTCFCNGSIPSYINNSDFFMYFNTNHADNRRNYENWFIKAHPQNRTLCIIRDLLFEFWRNENKYHEYFIWNLFLSMAFKKYPEDDKIFNVPMNICFMITDLSKEFNYEEWVVAYQLSFVQKLTYRFNQNKNIKESYFSYIKSICERNN